MIISKKKSFIIFNKADEKNVVDSFEFQKQNPEIIPWSKAIEFSQKVKETTKSREQE